MSFLPRPKFDRAAIVLAKFRALSTFSPISTGRFKLHVSSATRQTKWIASETF
jgi:hypothetical protein